MNGYPKNHDCANRQPKHDELQREVDEWCKTHEIEKIDFGKTSDSDINTWSKQKWAGKILSDDFDED